MTDDELLQVEALIPAPLPADARSFLAEYAGVSTGIGYEDDPCGFFVVQAADGSMDTTGLSYFASCERMVSSYKILTGDSPHFDAGPRIPPRMMPISMSDNDLVLLDLTEDNHGAVWHWRGIEETWGSDDNNELGFVAASFTAFVDSLATLEEADAQARLRRWAEPR